MHSSSSFCILSSSFTDRVSDFFLKILCFNVEYSSTHTSHSPFHQMQDKIQFRSAKRGDENWIWHIWKFLCMTMKFSLLFVKKAKIVLICPKKQWNLNFYFMECVSIFLWSVLFFEFDTISFIFWSSYYFIAIW